MSNSAYSPTIQQLQGDTIDLLHRIEGLMHRASETLKADGTGEKYAKFAQEVAKKREDVSNLELVMSIVAPMKAGKSTIINAIVGCDLLPSRAAAMTTLPTEIILNKELEQPIMTVAPLTLKAFDDTFQVLKQRIQREGLTTTQEKIAQYPHLNELLCDIESREELFNVERVEGIEKIKEVLTRLNDIVRLCCLLEPSKDPLAYVTVLPRIETPFWRSQQKNNQTDALGNLVIVDTPGPNEAGENLRLSAVVEAQLRKSSIILIVLDFTQLNNKAAEDIKRQVKPIITLLGKEKLYVLVNKVDQRTEDDPMTSDKVQQFVLADLELGNAGDKDRIFEVAARWAFRATNFMLEVQNNTINDICTNKAARALAEQTLGRKWQTKLERIDLEDLQEEAESLWEDSGFQIFLEKAISALMQKAAPLAIQSALSHCRGLLGGLKDDVSLRGSAIIQDEEKLRSEINILEVDLRRLDACRTKRQDVERIRASIQDQLAQILQKVKNDAIVDLKEFFEKEHFDKVDPLGKLRAVFEKWFTGKKYDPVAKLEFKTEWEAEQFTNHAISYAQSKAESVLCNYRKQVERIINDQRSALAKLLERETKPIIEQAQKRIQEKFEVDLFLPIPQLNTKEEISARPRIQRETRTIDGGYETVYVPKRVWWHWLWIVPAQIPEQRKKPDKKEDYFTVALGELIPEINRSVEQGFEIIQQGLDKYLREDIQSRVDTYFDALDTYLANYRDSLKQAQLDQMLSLEEKEKFVSELNKIAPEAQDYIKKCNSYLMYVEHLFLVNKVGN